MLADDLIYTHSSARLDTKKSLIDNMTSGATVYTSVEPSDVKAQDLGDTVVLTGIAQIKVVSERRAQRLRRPLHRRLRQAQRTLANGNLAVDAAAGLTRSEETDDDRSQARPQHAASG